MSDISSFDPEAFMGETVEGANSTRTVPVPAGNYQSIIEDVNVRQTEKGQVILDVTHEILDEELKAALDRDKVTVRQSIFLDLDERGKIDHSEGKNVRLGRLREAVGQNEPGAEWGLRMLKGAGPLTIQVTQRPDKNDPETIYNDVSRVAPPA